MLTAAFWKTSMQSSVAAKGAAVGRHPNLHPSAKCWRWTSGWSASHPFLKMCTGKDWTENSTVLSTLIIWPCTTLTLFIITVLLRLDCNWYHELNVSRVTWPDEVVCCGTHLIAFTSRIFYMWSFGFVIVIYVELFIVSLRTFTNHMTYRLTMIMGQRLIHYGLLIY